MWSRCWTRTSTNARITRPVGTRCGKVQRFSCEKKTLVDKETFLGHTSRFGTIELHSGRKTCAVKFTKRVRGICSCCLTPFFHFPLSCRREQDRIFVFSCGLVLCSCCALTVEQILPSQRFAGSSSSEMERSVFFTIRLSFVRCQSRSLSRAGSSRKGYQLEKRTLQVPPSSLGRGHVVPCDSETHRRGWEHVDSARRRSVTCPSVGLG